MINLQLRVLSLGAGVQSTTLALMAKHGEIEAPDFAIFADTGNEKLATYEHLDWLGSVLPFPIVRKRRSDLDLATETVLHYQGDARGTPYTPPFFYPGGMFPSYCSKEWKTRVVIRELRRRLGYDYGERVINARVEVWLGITTDEAHRQKPSEAPWITNRWPLIERRMHRGECGPWLSRHGYPMPPRSACVHCPNQGDREWAEMDPWDFGKACALDDAIRDGGNGTTGPLYVSRHLRPLREIDFKALMDSPQGDLFGNECEGMCGV